MRSSRLAVRDRDISDLWYRVAKDAAAAGNTVLAASARRSARAFRGLR